MAALAGDGIELVVGSYGSTISSVIARSTAATGSCTGRQAPSGCSPSGGALSTILLVVVGASLLVGIGLLIRARSR